MTLHSPPAAVLIPGNHWLRAGLSTPTQNAALHSTTLTTQEASPYADSWHLTRLPASSHQTKTHDKNLFQSFHPTLPTPLQTHLVPPPGQCTSLQTIPALCMTRFNNNKPTTTSSKPTQQTGVRLAYLQFTKKLCCLAKWSFIAAQFPQES